MWEFCCKLDTNRMNLTAKTRRFLLLFLLCVLFTSMAAPAAFAQGCAMCYTSAAAASAAAMRSLNIGILVLLLPPLAMFIGILTYTIRRAQP